MLNFLFFYVYHRKFSNSRSIYHCTTKMPKMHLCKSSGVFSFVVRFRNDIGFQVQIWLKCIHQSRFSCTRMSEKYRRFIFDNVLEVYLNSVYLQKKLAAFDNQVFHTFLAVLPQFLLLQNSINLFC